jgi:HSP20 family protein
MAKISKKKVMDQPVSKDIGMIFRYLYEEAENIGVDRESAITHTPVVDILSTSNNIIIEVELPGVRLEEIYISILRNAVTIKALKYECFDEKKLHFICLERSFGRFLRVIDIPSPVDTGSIKATFRDGLLTITLPIIGEKRGAPKKIEVEP